MKPRPSKQGSFPGRVLTRCATRALEPDQTLDIHMNTKTFFSLLLVTTLATTTALAEDGFNFGVDNAAQVEKTVKAQREQPNGMGSTMARSMGWGFVAAINPVLIIPAVIGHTSNVKNHLVEINTFYSGTVVRGKVKKVIDLSGYGKDIPTSLHKAYGLNVTTAPGTKTIEGDLVKLVLDVDGSTDSDRIVYARRDAVYYVGDIVDAKTLDGIYPLVYSVNDKLITDFNRHIPRVIALYCKHDNPICQNDYDSSLGVLYRHTDKEFPPSQYLIDPAIIAADQVKMRKEEEEKKSAQGSSVSDLI